jgi:hypothetical protein
MQVLEIRTAARAAGLLVAGVVAQRIDLGDIGTPVRELVGLSGSKIGEPFLDACTRFAISY